MLIYAPVTDLSVLEAHKADLQDKYLKGDKVGSIATAITLMDSVLNQPKGAIIKVNKVIAYSKERYQPVGAIREALKEITGKDTLSKAEMAAWQQLGFGFELARDELDLSPEAIAKEKAEAHQQGTKISEGMKAAAASVEQEQAQASAG